MADFSKYTDMPLAANAADFAMEEYDPENPVTPECPFVTSFFQEGSFCDECYSRAYEARKQLLDFQLDRTIQPFMEMAEYMAMKMFEAGWKAAKAEK